ncbi:MAG: CarD family transcriptional regulator [bacterium]|nr:CarD family transcriptional regulator [bacterium]
MFKIGDRVVYPMHGAGVIEGLEEREILGEKKFYYVMKLPLGDMKVFIPLQSIASLGLREIVDGAEIGNVLQALGETQVEEPGNWNRRYRVHLDKLRTGSMIAVAQVVSTLLSRQNAKSLSAGEKRLLEIAMQILVSELILVQNLSEEEAKDLVVSSCIRAS